MVPEMTGLSPFPCGHLSAAPTHSGPLRATPVSLLSLPGPLWGLKSLLLQKPRSRLVFLPRYVACRFPSPHLWLISLATLSGLLRNKRAWVIHHTGPFSSAIC